MKIIVNPESGHGDGLRKIRDLQRIIKDRKLCCSLLKTEYPGHATVLAAAAVAGKDPRIGVMGGDGTVSEVVNGIRDSGTELGILPVGTGNDFARTLNLPLDDLSAGLDVLLSGVIREVDVGEAADRFFLSVVGVGLPVLVAAEANKMRKLKGPTVFFWAILKGLLRMKPYPAEIRLDDRTLTVNFTSILVQNTAYTGGGLLLAPKARIDDGLLDVVVVDNIGKLNLLLSLPKLFSGRHLDHPNFSCYQSETVELKTDKTLPTMFDGEVFGQTPLRIASRRKCVNIVIRK